MGKVLKGGVIVTSEKTYCADLRIEDEKIQDIGIDIEKPGDEIIYVDGCYLLPGGIDTHTHFDLGEGRTKTADDFESGTKGAIVGGTTTILDFANHVRGDSLSKTLDIYKNKTDKNCYCDYGFHMAMSEWNEEIEKEMEYMVQEGITSFKMYMAYKHLQVDDGAVFQALKKSKEINGLIGFHCENGDLANALIEDAKKNNKLKPIYHALTKPPVIEEEAIERLLTIAKMADAPAYIVHLSSKAGLEIALDKKKDGAKVVIETCPQYLTLFKDLYRDENDSSFEGAKYVISPPLREKEDGEALWEALRNEDIHTIGTDHCPFNFVGQKDIGKEDFTKIPNGAPGVEHRMVVLYSEGVAKNKITLSDMVRLTSTNAAKIFGLYPKKGELQIGSDADVIVLNPNKKWTISKDNQNQNVDYTPYEGLKSECSLDKVFLRGQLMASQGKLVNNHKIGTYIKRKPFDVRWSENV
jgi:dihydropyrimidinase